MGTGIHGGFGNTNHEKPLSGKNLLPKDDSQLKHIFSGKEGHLCDTPENRKLLIDLANDQKKFVGKDKYGNCWNIDSDANGIQTWVRYQNGTINEGGQNQLPRSWNTETGLNNNPVKRRRAKK